MPNQLQPSRACVALVKSFEGLRRDAGRLPSGGWTIGYGHTLSAREGARVDERDADALLLFDLRRTADAVRPLVFAALSQNQFDALTAFAFNVGDEAFRASQVLKRVNVGDHLGAASALERWRAADFEGERLVIDALVRRRAAEKALYLTPLEGFPAAPTPVLRPLFDDQAGDPLDARAGRAVELHAALDGEPALTRIDEAARRVRERLQARFPAPETPAELAAEPAPFEAPQASDAGPLEETEPYPGPETAGLGPSAPEAANHAMAAEPLEASDPSLLGAAAARTATGPTLAAPEQSAPSPAERRSGAWIVGLIGLGLFAFSILHMLEDRATAGNLIGGLIGAVLIAYAAARMTGRREPPRDS